MDTPTKERRPKRMISLRSRLFMSVGIGLTFVALMIGVYYYSFRRMAIDQIHNAFQNVTGEVEAHIHTALGSVEQAARVAGYSIVVQRGLLSLSPVERIQNMSVAIDALDNAKTFQDSILDIIIYVDDHNYLFTGSDSVYTDFSHLTLFRAFIRDRALSTDEMIQTPFYSQVRYGPNEKKPYLIYYLPIRNALPVAEKRQDAAFVLVLCDLNRMMALPLRGNMENGILALIHDGEIHHTSVPISGPLAEMAIDAPDGIGTVQVEGVVRLTYAFDVEETGWKIVYSIAENSLVGDLFASRNLFYLFLLVGTVVVLVSILSSLLTLSRSIFSVVEDVQSLSGEEPAEPVRLPRVAELAILANQINRMLARVETLHAARQQSQKRAYDAIIAQQQAAMVAYRSQINPHFLFNTLECIRSMAQYYKAGDLAELIWSTSRLLEYSLYAESIVPFSQELSHLKSYMRVISIRYPGRYDFRVHVSEAAMGHPILSMVLQPLAENAVLHGARVPRHGAQLVVSIKAWVDEDNVLWARVADNGKGIPAEKLAMLNRHVHALDHVTQLKRSSIGIDNIYSRLKLVDSRCALRLYSREGYYTVSELRVPWDISFTVPALIEEA